FPPVNLATRSAASLAAADAFSLRPMNVSAALEAPIANAVRRDSSRIDIFLRIDRSGPQPALADHSGARRIVQIVFIKNNTSVHAAFVQIRNQPESDFT